MEQYLIDEYDVWEDYNWLTCEDDIEEYFKDCDYHELLPCGQGYATEEASLICKIGDKFYHVDIYASTCSAKQDYGDRLFWIESIDKVEWHEIPKPKEKEKKVIEYVMTLNNDQRIYLERIMKEAKINWRYLK